MQSYSGTEHSNDSLTTTQI